MTYVLKFDKADVTETEFCKIKNNSVRSLIIDEETIAIHLLAGETLLSARFPDKDFNDYLNLLRFLITKTTVEENVKAFVSYFEIALKRCKFSTKNHFSIS